jgi:hypothetical protein
VSRAAGVTLVTDHRSYIGMSGERWREISIRNRSCATPALKGSALARNPMRTPIAAVAKAAAKARPLTPPLRYRSLTDHLKGERSHERSRRLR